MGDQGRWFKLWTTAPDDPQLGTFPVADFGRWCKFGAYLKAHGKNGVIDLQAPPHPLAHPLQSHFQMDSFDAVITCIRMFPNCIVTDVTGATVTFRVEWKNWPKYQGDFTGDRVAKHRASVRESVTPKKRREQKRREEIKKREDPLLPNPSSPVPEPPAWGTVEALIELYNSATPNECPEVERITPGRREKARRYLAAFPDRAFWESVFREIHDSKFLRGFVKREGHATFVADFDWLLTKGRDGTENAAKVAEGKFHD